MKEYKVRVTETSVAHLRIKANDESHAKALVEEIYENGNIDFVTEVFDINVT